MPFRTLGQKDPLQELMARAAQSGKDPISGVIGGMQDFMKMPDPNQPPVAMQDQQAANPNIGGAATALGAIGSLTKKEGAEDELPGGVDPADIAKYQKEGQLVRESRQQAHRGGLGGFVGLVRTLVHKSRQKEVEPAMQKYMAAQELFNQDRMAADLEHKQNQAETSRIVLEDKRREEKIAGDMRKSDTVETLYRRSNVKPKDQEMIDAGFERDQTDQSLLGGGWKTHGFFYNPAVVDAVTRDFPHAAEMGFDRLYNTKTPKANEAAEDVIKDAMTKFGVERQRVKRYEQVLGMKDTQSKDLLREFNKSRVLFEPQKLKRVNSLANEVVRFSSYINGPDGRSLNVTNPAQITNDVRSRIMEDKTLAGPALRAYEMEINAYRPALNRMRALTKDGKLEKYGYAESDVDEFEKVLVGENVDLDRIQGFYKAVSKAGGGPQASATPPPGTVGIKGKEKSPKSLWIENFVKSKGRIPTTDEIVFAERQKEF